MSGQWRSGLRSIVIAAAVAGAACHQHARAADPAEGAPDALQGFVSVTGTGFEQRLMLQTGTRATRLVALPADSAALTRLAGVWVLVRGATVQGSMRVQDFTALRVGAAEVVDGVVRLDGGKVVLETSAGTVELGNPPAALLKMGGARVWVSGPLGTGPNSYGVIVP